MADVVGGAPRTFLFTDLESSTALWEREREAMTRALARHDDSLRAAIGRHTGVVFATGGDGFAAAFDSAAQAVLAAVAAQRGLASEAWPQGAELRSRMALHTGDAEERDDNFFGPTLNHAARLMSAAHGGQILLSLVTERLVVGALPPDVAAIPLGPHSLRYLPAAEEVFQVVAPGLIPDFPPLRVATAQRGNLPRKAATFLGRSDERQEIASLMQTAPLVTITGVGGVGKSRLAVKVAQDLQPSRADGGWICELASASDGVGMLQVVATALGAPPPARPVARGQHRGVPEAQGPGADPGQLRAPS